MAEILLGGDTAGATAPNAANLHLTMLLSGQYEGSTTLDDGTFEYLSGDTAGNTSLSTTNARLVLNLSGATYGATNLGNSNPLPIVGHTALASYMEIVSGISVAQLCTCDEGKVFRWGHVFTRFDLPLYIKDSSCTLPRGPFEVTYAMYRLLGNGIYQLAGPSCRTPVNQRVGEYYATGTAGEFGQPGDWQIRWSIRRSFNDPVVTKTYSFRVVDSVSSAIPGDPTDRKIKYGWS